MKKIALIGLVSFLSIWAISQNFQTNVLSNSIENADNFISNNNTVDNVEIAPGIDEKIVAPEFSEAYPNPASQYVSFDYLIPNANTKAKVVIYNILGKEVKDIAFPEQSGTLKANTSDLVEGIYFYSFVINNKSEVTQKLIIKH